MIEISDQEIKQDLDAWNDFQDRCDEVKRAFPMGARVTVVDTIVGYDNMNLSVAVGDTGVVEYVDGAYVCVKVKGVKLIALASCLKILKD